MARFLPDDRIYYNRSRNFESGTGVVVRPMRNLPDHYVCHIIYRGVKHQMVLDSNAPGEMTLMSRKETGAGK